MIRKGVKKETFKSVCKINPTIKINTTAKINPLFDFKLVEQIITKSMICKKYFVQWKVKFIKVQFFNLKVVKD